MFKSLLNTNTDIQGGRCFRLVSPTGLLSDLASHGQSIAVSMPLSVTNYFRSVRELCRRRSQCENRELRSKDVHSTMLSNRMYHIFDSTGRVWILPLHMKSRRGGMILLHWKRRIKQKSKQNAKSMLLAMMLAMMLAIHLDTFIRMPALL